MSRPSPFPGFDRIALGQYEPRVAARLEAWQREEVGCRIWARDHTVWSPVPVPELTDRLGWLDLPETTPDSLDEQLEFADAIVNEGFEHIVLLGMGGSGLAPRMFQATFGSASGHPGLLVLDSTHPAAVTGIEASVDLSRTLFVVSSKSGTTLETMSAFRYFWARVSDLTAEPGRHFVAITDPGTPLDTLARSRGMRRVFTAPPDVGGRYSALSVFGTLPASLIGVDVHRLLQRAQIMAADSAASVPAPSNPALVLGAILGELTSAGRDKVTFIPSASVAPLPAWLEQLVAESTGKMGRGIVPVAGEPTGPPTVYAPDRLFVAIVVDEEPGDEKAFEALVDAGFPAFRLRLADRYDLGLEIFRWELATAAAGRILGVQPFDQPDVQLAKDLAREAMARAGQPGGQDAGVAEVPATSAAPLGRALGSLLGTRSANDYIAIQAYLAPSDTTMQALGALQARLRNRTHLAATWGFGPGFLHSTGQLHKGGPNTAIVLQIVDAPSRDLPVPETDFTFGTLIRGQAIGDFRALAQRGRRLLRVNLGPAVEAGLDRLLEACTVL